MTGRPVRSADLGDGCRAGESSAVSAKPVDVMCRILFVILAVLIVATACVYASFARDWQELNLLKLSAGGVTEPGTGTAQVVRSYFIDGGFLGALTHDHQTTFSLMPEPQTVPLWVNLI